MDKSQKLFSLLTPQTIKLDPLEAELTKLFANAYRYIHFSIANQFYQIALSQNLDFDRICAALTQDYPRMKDFPKPGFTAGPCLLKDTMQLSAFANNNFNLGHAAMLVNEGMPRFIIDTIKKTTPLSDKTVGILGMAFKSESDDKRDSLSYKLARLLRIEAKKVYCSDEYIMNEGFMNAEALIELSDLIIIGTPHLKYKTLKFNPKSVFDIWGITSDTSKLQ